MDSSSSAENRFNGFKAPIIYAYVYVVVEVKWVVVQLLGVQVCSYTTKRKEASVQIKDSLMSNCSVCSPEMRLQACVDLKAACSLYKNI